MVGLSVRLKHAGCAGCAGRGRAQPGLASSFIDPASLCGLWVVGDKRMIYALPVVWHFPARQARLGWGPAQVWHVVDVIGLLGKARTPWSPAGPACLCILQAPRPWRPFPPRPTPPTLVLPHLKPCACSPMWRMEFDLLWSGSIGRHL